MAEEPSNMESGTGTESSQAQGPSAGRQELGSDTLVRYVRRMAVAMLQEGDEVETALELCLASSDTTEAIRKYIRDAQERTLQVSIRILICLIP